MTTSQKQEDLYSGLACFVGAVIFYSAPHWVCGSIPNITQHACMFVSNFVFIVAVCFMIGGAYFWVKAIALKE
jgi:hypothetical protein